MEQNPLIVRSIDMLQSVGRPVSGAELQLALREATKIYGGEYQEVLFSDIDGKKTHRLGISHGHPAKDISLRVGGKFEQEGIDLSSQEFVRVGVGSTSWPGEKYAIGYGEGSISEAVQWAREYIVQALQSGANRD